MMTKKIQILKNKFTLHASGALYWHEQNMLIVADLHVGKVMHFRKSGIPVPLKALERNGEQLDHLVAYFKPGCICFLGDLFHSDFNSEWPIFMARLSTLNARFILVTGNHDILAKTVYERAGLETVPEMKVGDFLLTHYPHSIMQGYNICGHIHPCVRLRGKGHASIKLPCFVRQNNQLILPAVGVFTGKYEVKPNKSDVIYALVEQQVCKILIEGKRRT